MVKTKNSHSCQWIESKIVIDVGQSQLPSWPPKTASNLTQDLDEFIIEGSQLKDTIANNG